MTEQPTVYIFTVLQDFFCRLPDKDAGIEDLREGHWERFKTGEVHRLPEVDLDAIRKQLTLAGVEPDLFYQAEVETESKTIIPLE